MEKMIKGINITAQAHYLRLSIVYKLLASLILALLMLFNSLTAQADYVLKDGAPPYAYLKPEGIKNAIPRQEPLSLLGNPAFYEVYGQRYTILPTSKGYLRQGIASWYGTKFHGKRTSSGEPYNMYGMTAANRHLPIPCYVRVTNLENGKKIIVKVNDRGPFHDNRLIDLSYAAAVKLDMLGKGTAQVQVEALEPFQYYLPNPTAITAAMKKPLQYAKKGATLYLQLGAFGQLHNAREFAEEISAAIAEVVDVFKVQNEIGTMYRVKIGPLVDELHAAAVNNQLKAAGLSKGIILKM